MGAVRTHQQLPQPLVSPAGATRDAARVEVIGMSYTRDCRIDLVDSATGRHIASYPETQAALAQQEALRESMELTHGRNCTRVAVCRIPLATRPERAA
jgi:hypothetical protein